MGLLGMVVSGSGFLFMGVWQAWISLTGQRPVPSSSTSPSAIATSSLRKAPPLFSSAQMVCVAALSFLNIISGLVASRGGKALADDIGSAVPLERSAVALVFLIFSVTNLLSMHTSFLPLPREIICLISLFAFGQEFLLFHLQRPDAGLESRYYTLLQVPIVASMMSIGASIVSPASLLPPLGLAGSLFLQGTWLMQMGVTFFTSAYMPKGCVLHMRGEGDYVINCDSNDMALMRGKAVATLQFNCHMALLLTLLMPFYSIMRKHSGSSNADGLNYEMVATVDSINGKGYTDVLSPPPSAFSLELEEDLDDDRSVSQEHHQDANGFHRVTI